MSDCLNVTGCCCANKAQVVVQEIQDQAKISSELLGPEQRCWKEELTSTVSSNSFTAQKQIASRPNGRQSGMQSCWDKFAVHSRQKTGWLTAALKASAVSKLAKPYPLLWPSLLSKNSVSEHCTEHSTAVSESKTWDLQSLWKVNVCDTAELLEIHIQLILT